MRCPFIVLSTRAHLAGLQGRQLTSEAFPRVGHTRKWQNRDPLQRPRCLYPPATHTLSRHHSAAQYAPPLPKPSSKPELEAWYEVALGPWALTWLSGAGQHEFGGPGLGRTHASTGPSTGPPDRCWATQHCPRGTHHTTKACWVWAFLSCLLAPLCCRKLLQPRTEAWATQRGACAGGAALQASCEPASVAPRSFLRSSWKT